MVKISIDVASQLITNYVKLVVNKETQEKKLSNQEYLILLVYYIIMYIDEGSTELKEYMDKRFQELDKRFEALESEIKELRKEVNDIKAKIATIETRLDNIEKEIADLKDLMR